MIASTEWRRGMVLALAACVGFAAAGCSKKSTSPTPAGSVSGRVVHSTGHRAANVDVTLTSVTGTLASLDLTVADTLGGFSFPKVTPGSYVLYSRDFADSCGADTLTVVNGGATADTLILVPGGTLAGVATLSDRADSKGIALYVDHLLTLTTADSATGAYRLHDVPPGNWTLRATCIGHADVIRAVTIPNPGDTVQVAPIQLVPGAPSSTIPARMLEYTTRRH